MGVKPGANKKQNNDTVGKYANSQECEACDTKCVKGIAHLQKLAAKHKSNCPLCKKKK
jgi:hypothetical protein